MFVLESRKTINFIENGRSEFPTSSFLGQDDTSTHHAEDQLLRSKLSCLHPILPMDGVRAHGDLDPGQS